MSNKKYTQINATIKKKAGLTSLGKKVHIRIICKPQYAVSVWSDKKLAQKIVKMGKKKGDEIYYNKELNLVTQKYPNKSEQEIVSTIKKELEAIGGEIEK